MIASWRLEEAFNQKVLQLLAIVFGHKLEEVEFVLSAIEASFAAATPLLGDVFILHYLLKPLEAGKLF
jgi:hypothetical protein